MAALDNLSDDQLDLPVSYSPDLVVVTLRQYLAHASAHAPQELPALEKSQITCLRLEQQPDDFTFPFGERVLNKDEALCEVRKMSPAGSALMNREFRLIRSLLHNNYRAHA